MRAKLVATGAVLGHHSASLALAVVRIEGRGPERRRQAALGPGEAAPAGARAAGQQGSRGVVWGSGRVGCSMCTSAVGVCVACLACAVARACALVWSSGAWACAVAVGLVIVARASVVCVVGAWAVG